MAPLKREIYTPYIPSPPQLQFPRGVPIKREILLELTVCGPENLGITNGFGHLPLQQASFDDDGSRLNAFLQKKKTNKHMAPSHLFIPMKTV